MAKQKNSKKTANKKIDNEILIVLYSFLAIALSIIGILEIGPAGILLSRLMYFLIGILENIVFAGVIVVALFVLFKKDIRQIKMKYSIGIICFFLAWILLVAAPEDHSIIGMDVLNNFIQNIKEIFNNTLIAPIGNGGILGAILYALFSALFDFTGTRIMVVMFILLGIIMFWDPIKKVFGFASDTAQKQKVKRNIKKEERELKKEEKKKEKLLFDEDEVSYEEEQGQFKFGQLTADIIDKKEEPVQTETIQIIDIKPDVVKETKETKKEVEIESSFLVDYAKYRLPSISLLNVVTKGSVSNTNKKAAQENGQKLLQILEEFGVKAALVDTHIGPSVTKFELKPDLGVKVSKISNLQNDIKLALAAKDIRIEAPIPSKSAVGIEIPNIDKTVVGLREILKQVPSKYENSKLLFALGKDLLGQPVYGELNKMPHLLIAGATGSGKSVCVNSIIVSILMRAKPNEVK